MKAKTLNTNKKKEHRITFELIKKILRTVPQNEAFYFFTGLGQYSGKYATSLDCFCNKIKMLEAKSLVFHFKRKDFEKWIERTIGDAILANKIGGIEEPVDGDELRTEIHRIVEQRLSELKKLLASEDVNIKHF